MSNASQRYKESFMKKSLSKKEKEERRKEKKAIVDLARRRAAYERSNKEEMDEFLSLPDPELFGSRWVREDKRKRKAKSSHLPQHHGDDGNDVPPQRQIRDGMAPVHSQCLNAVVITA